jgi:hypothetical protein
VRLHGEIVKALATADVKQRLITQGFDAGGNTPEQFTSDTPRSRGWRGIAERKSVWSKAAALLLAGYCAAAQPQQRRTAILEADSVNRALSARPPDLIARAVSEPLAHRLGQQVVIDNRGAPRR